MDFLWHLCGFIVTIFISRAHGSNIVLDRCCETGLDGESEGLLQCLGNFMPKLERSFSQSLSFSDDSLKIGIVTYFDENIQEYAAYSITLNLGYAYERHYSFMALSPETRSNYEPLDPRWNRVQILRKLMTNDLDPVDTLVTGAFRDYDYVVWLDADLIVLDCAVEHVGRYFDIAIIVSIKRESVKDGSSRHVFFWCLEFSV